MRLYVAGPMSGLVCYNFPAFDAARDRLVAQGHEVVSPADLSRASGVAQDGSFVPEGWSYVEAMRQDLAAIFTVDAVYMLPNWEKSTGARAEHAVAVCIGKRIIYESAPSEVVL